MSQSFAFPPPPPPPPKRDLNPNTNAYPRPIFNRGRGRGSGDFRGNHLTRGSDTRGRGRGQGRGRGRDGNSTNSHNHTGQQLRHRRPSFENGISTSKVSNNGPSTVHPSNSAKRNHVTAFGNNFKSSTRPQAPPAVPSFNADIESLIAKTTQVQPVIKPAVPKKSNLLGLTPSNHLSESESEEDDDEAKLAQFSGLDGLTFNHNGATLSLRTPAEIAAWIAERKRKYPTSAKREAAQKEAEAKKREWEARQKEREEEWKVRKEEKAKQRHEQEKQKIKQRLLAQVTAKAKAAIAAKNDDGSHRALTKAEKLRKEIERATRQLQEAEEALKKAEAESLDKVVMDLASSTVEGESGMNSEIAQDGDTLEELSKPNLASLNVEATSDEEADDTSSSGSSASDSESTPEELSSKIVDQESISRHSQSMAQDTLQPCRNYAKLGKCKYGRKCRYSHKIPKKEISSKGNKELAPGRRKGLYQIMVEKEQEEEQKRALRAIIALGDRGLLKDDISLASQEPISLAVAVDPSSKNPHDTMSM